MVVVCIGTNNIGRMRKETLCRQFEGLGSNLESITSNVIISGLLPDLCANWQTVHKIREMNR